MAAIANKNSVRKKFKDFNLETLSSIVSSARKGVSAKVFYDFAETVKIPEKNLAVIINLSARTIGNYKTQRKMLAPAYSEHLLKLIALFEKGEDIFGNIDEFNYWLKKPLWNSEDKPSDWIVTQGGVDMIMEELDRLAQGYPA